MSHQISVTFYSLLQSIVISKLFNSVLFCRLSKEISFKNQNFHSLEKDILKTIFVLFCFLATVHSLSPDFPLPIHKNTELPFAITSFVKTDSIENSRTRGNSFYSQNVYPQTMACERKKYILCDGVVCFRGGLYEKEISDKRYLGANTHKK